MRGSHERNAQTATNTPERATCHETRVLRPARGRQATAHRTTLKTAMALRQVHHVATLRALNSLRLPRHVDSWADFDVCHGFAPSAPVETSRGCVTGLGREQGGASFTRS